MKRPMIRLAVKLIPLYATLALIATAASSEEPQQPAPSVGELQQRLERLRLSFEPGPAGTYQIVTFGEASAYLLDTRTGSLWWCIFTQCEPVSFVTGTSATGEKPKP